MYCGSKLVFIRPKLGLRPKGLRPISEGLLGNPPRGVKSGLNLDRFRFLSPPISPSRRGPSGSELRLVVGVTRRSVDSTLLTTSFRGARTCTPAVGWGLLGEGRLISQFSVTLGTEMGRKVLVVGNVND